MVRNAVDHGLEKTAEERVNAGKNPIGRVELRAFYKGGNVCIEISDDGRGLDPAKLIKKATEKGLIKPGQTLTDKEAFDLIFAPGFSTAEKVTDVSGRGVGMDVVRRNIEELHGHVEIESALGIGTLFRIRIPNTLAIIEGMVVLCGAERYVFPTQSIVRAVRPTESQIIPGKGVKQRMIDLGDEILPLYKLADLYGVNDSIDNPVDAIVLVLDNNGKHTCLLVDRIIKQQQFVSKTLGDMFKGVPGVSGGTIMSDGQVGLLVDVGLLMQSFSSKLRNIKEENS
jgi:two-component system chemotaxis sensor kinase CheA